MNMDASSAQENRATGQISSPGQTTLKQELEFGSGSLSGEATEETHAIGTETVNKGLTEARAVECDYICIEQFRPLHEDLTKCERLGQQPEDDTMNPDQLSLLPEDVAGKNRSTKQAILELNHEVVSQSVNGEALTETQKIGTENFHNGPAETVIIKSDHLGLEQPCPPSEHVTRNSSCEQLRPLPEDQREPSREQLGLPPEDEAENTGLEQLEPLPDNLSKNCDLERIELPPEDAVNNPNESGGRGRRTSAKSTKGKCALRSSVGNTRVLRSRLQEKTKAPEPDNNVEEHDDGANGEKRRKKRKKRQMKKIPVDEFSRIRKHLRYLLNRMSYEQNLIDAYSGEGWKGQSLEKIKPEKELQRAKSEIFRCKLKIRDLFQRLDLLIAEGRLPKSLFDSEGQIDSEDIFCAKCGSKDLPADNDIILCDGACERGFHQFCLVPPLLKEDIPPNDEGWLCPGCDCKVDCIDLLNDSQGTNLSVLNTWEKVYPEAAAAAAAAAAGNKLDNSFGLPSDESEDNDYDPDGSEVDDKVEGDESSSDESDFYSASEDFEASPNNKQNLELPSDDSEDDDYDPNAPDLDEQVKQESSSSDFTSDAEDFSVAFNDNRSPYKDDHVSASPDHSSPSNLSDGERSKVSRRKKQSLNDELLSLLESSPGQGDSAPVSGKRHVETLDYKKLYDETYGDVSCDSSDEDWMDANDALKKRRKNNTEKVASGSPGGRIPIIEGANAKDMKHRQEENEHTPKRRARKKLDAEGTYNSPPKSHKGSSEVGSSCSTKRSPYRRLGETVTQGLLNSFKENQYPERATKENLAKELGITVHQVSKWFENARWSFRHSSHMEASMVKTVPNRGIQPETNLSETGPKMVTEDVACNGVGIKERNIVNAGVTMSNSLTEERSRQRSTTSRGRKRKSQLAHQASDQLSSVEETRNLSVSVDLPKAQEARKRGRPRSKKSAA